MTTHFPAARSTLRLLLAAGAAAGGLFLSAARAQTAITSITTTFTTGGATSSESILGSRVTNDNDTLAVNTMTDAQGNLYTTSGSTQFAAAYVRTANAQSTSSTTDPADLSAWYMGTSAASSSSAPTTILGSYDTAASGTGTLLVGNNVLAGADNVFNNVDSASSGNNASDVERLDLVYNGTTGTTASNSLSIGVFDRGTGDTFEIAIITGVDGTGKPTSYGGNLLTVTAAEFGNSLLNSGNANGTVLNSSGSPTEYLLRYDSTTSLAASNVTDDTTHQNQNIAGVVFNLSDFGIAPGTTIYGYSLMAGGVTDGGNINNLVNYNNTTYFSPNTNENSSAGDNGGLDPVAVNGVLFTEHPIPEPSAYGALFLGVSVAGLVLYRRRRLIGGHSFH